MIDGETEDKWKNVNNNKSWQIGRPKFILICGAIILE